MAVSIYEYVEAAESRFPENTKGVIMREIACYLLVMTGTAGILAGLAAVELLIVLGQVRGATTTKGEVKRDGVQGSQDRSDL